MGLLARTAAAALAPSLLSCYAPEVRDCTVKCFSETDCAGDQLCGADGYCVSLEDTRCMAPPGAMPGSTTPDAGLPVTVGDAGVADAANDAPPDAATYGIITLRIDGKGFVQLEGIATCATTCEYMVPLAHSLTMHAYPDDDFRFDKWTTSACPDEDERTCTFVPAIELELGAKFRKDN